MNKLYSELRWLISLRKQFHAFTSEESDRAERIRQVVGQNKEWQERLVEETKLYEELLRRYQGKAANKEQELAMLYKMLDTVQPGSYMADSMQKRIKKLLAMKPPTMPHVALRKTFVNRIIDASDNTELNKAIIDMLRDKEYNNVCAYPLTLEMPQTYTVGSLATLMFIEQGAKTQIGTSFILGDIETYRPLELCVVDMNNKNNFVDAGIQLLELSIENKNINIADKAFKQIGRSEEAGVIADDAKTDALALRARFQNELRLGHHSEDNAIVRLILNLMGNFYTYVESLNSAYWKALPKGERMKASDVSNKLRGSTLVMFVLSTQDTKLFSDYDRYIQKSEPLEPEIRMKMIAALNELDIIVDQGENNTMYYVLNREISCSRSLIKKTTQFLNQDDMKVCIHTTKAQLMAETPEGLKRVIDTLSKKDRDDLADYGTTLSEAGITRFLNPFEVKVQYQLPVPAGNKHNASRRKAKFIEYFSPEGSEGECIPNALRCFEPRPTDEEIADNSWKTKYQYTIISSVSAGRTWSILESNMKDPLPDNFNISTAILLYNINGHMWRVMRIAPPMVKTRHAIKYHRVGEHICEYGVHGVISDSKDLNTAFKAGKNYVTIRGTETASTKYFGHYEVKIAATYDIAIEEWCKANNKKIATSKSLYYANFSWARVSFDIESKRYAIKEICSGIEPEANGEYIESKFDVLFFKSVDYNGYVTKLMEHEVAQPSKTKEECLMFAFDSETVNSYNLAIANEGSVRPVLWALVGKDYSKHFIGINATAEFVEEIVRISKENSTKKVIFWSFNGASFDNYHIMHALAENSKLEFGATTRKYNGKDKPKVNANIVKSGSKLLQIVCDNAYIKDIRRFSSPVGTLDDFATAFKCKATKIGWDHNATQSLFERSESNIDKFLDNMRSMKGTDLLIHPDKCLPKKKESAEKEYAEAAKITAYDCYIHYCINDCMVTLEYADKVRQCFLGHTNSVLDINDYMTLPQAMYKYAISDCRMRNAKEKKIYKVSSIMPFKAKGDATQVTKVEDYLQRAVLAGRSQRFMTAPLGEANVPLGFLDIVSMYPHVMMQAMFPVGDKYHWTDHYEKGKLGFYTIHVTKQSNPVVLPYKAKDCKLGSHQWDYQGEFDIVAASCLLCDFWYFGGECTVKEGIVFEEATRGVLTPIINRFREVKMAQDVLKNSGKEFNSALRESAKLAMNSLSGKFIQKVTLDTIAIIRDPIDRERYINWLVEEKGLRRYKTVGGDAQINLVDLAEKERSIKEQLSMNYPMIVQSKQTRKQKLDEMKCEPRSLATGLWIYAWSQHHMIHALLSRCEFAKASFATETDSLHFDRVKYEEYCASHGIPYPYNIPAPEAKAPLDDPIFDMPCYDNPMLWPERLGFLRCHAMHKAYCKLHNIDPCMDKIPSADFGDYTAECGISKTGDFVNTNAIYIGKKCYYLDEFAGHPKQVIKGVGHSTHYASKELITAKDTTVEERIALKALIEKELTTKSVVDESLKGELFKTLSSGYGVDVFERRFIGNLDSISTDSCGMYTCVQTKRICPDSRYFLKIELESDSDVVKQCYEAPVRIKLIDDGIRERGAGANKYQLKYQGQTILSQDRTAIMVHVNSIKKDAYMMRGVTMELSGKKIYLTHNVLKFLR